jgi:hypothetical protein
LQVRNAVAARALREKPRKSLSILGNARSLGRMLMNVVSGGLCDERRSDQPSCSRKLPDKRIHQADLIVPAVNFKALPPILAANEQRCNFRCVSRDDRIPHA